MTKITFNAKGRSLRGLSDASEHIELHVGPEGLHQANGGGALSFTQRCGCNAADRESLSGGGLTIHMCKVLNDSNCFIWQVEY